MAAREKALELLKKGCVIPATPLVLKADRTLDEFRQRVLIRYYLNAGVGGIATAVHSTQFAIRDEDVNLFEPIIQLVADEIQKYEKRTSTIVLRICGVCGPTPQAVAEAKLAKANGYDAVLLSPGGLNQKAEAELLQRTSDVSAVLPVIGFYLQEAVGGRHLSYQYWQEMCKIKGVKAIKCAPFNRYQTLDVVRAVACSDRSDDITLYTGNDDNLIVDLLTPYEFPVNGQNIKINFKGGLLGHWCVGTRQAVKLFEDIKIAKQSRTVPPELLTKAAQVTDMNGAIFDAANNYQGCIPGIHEFLRREGLYESILCLNPDETLSAGQAAEITRVYNMYSQWNDYEFIKENIEHWRGDY